MDLVAFKEDIAANLAVFESYRTATSETHRTYFADRLRLGKQFVWSKVRDRYLFAPSRFAGYKACTFEKHSAFPTKDGRITTPAILGCSVDLPLIQQRKLNTSISVKNQE